MHFVLIKRGVQQNTPSEQFILSLLLAGENTVEPRTVVGEREERS